MHDLLRVDANERVDLRDFQFAVKNAMEDNSRQLAANFLTSPAGVRAWIVDGFAMSDGGASQLVVQNGVAFISMDRDGEVLEGVLATEGDASRTLDLTGYSNAVHGIYLRFSQVEGEEKGRIFWNSGSDTEYSQSVTTRYLANWAVRVERTNPGSDWLKIGEVNPTNIAGTLTDQRNFYFEGKVDDAYATTWGGGTDRNADRQQYGIKDLQTFVDMTKEAFEELRSSSGNRRWWEAGIRDLDLDTGPLRVGFTGGSPPDAKSVMVGDDGFYMGLLVGGTTPYINFDSGDQLFYSRSLNQWQWNISGWRMKLGTDGLILAQGLVVGYDGTPANDQVCVGDLNFKLDFNASLPQLNFDSGDRLEYDRTGNAYNFRIGGTLVGQFQTNGLVLDNNGIIAGYQGTPSGTLAAFGASPSYQMLLNWSSDQLPLFQFDPNDFIRYDRTNNLMDFVLGGATFLSLDDDPPAPRQKYVKAHQDFIVEDDDFALAMSTNPSIFFDGYTSLLADDVDYMTFRRSDDTKGQWELIIATGVALGANCPNGTQSSAQAWARGRFSVGFDPAAAFVAPDYSLSVGSGAFYMSEWEAGLTDPHIAFDGVADSLLYDRSANEFHFQVVSNVRAKVTQIGVMPGANDTHYLGYTGTDWFAGVYARHGAFKEDLQELTSDTQVIMRCGQNAVVARGRIGNNGTPGVQAVIGDHFNIINAVIQTAVSPHTIVVTFDRHLDVNDSVHAEFVNDASGTFSKWKTAVRFISTNQIEIQGYDTAAHTQGIPITDVLVTVIGKPNTLVT